MSLQRVVAPYGTWDSPLSPGAAASQATRFGALGISTAGEDPLVLWSESRPDERGRTAIVSAVDGNRRWDLGGPSDSARGRVNEYGGGALLVVPAGDRSTRVFWVDERGQQIQVTELLDTSASGAPVQQSRRSSPVTSLPVVGPRRHALGSPTPDLHWLVVEQEDHVDGSEAINEIVAVRVSDGRALTLVGRPALGGSSEGWGDFVVAPQVSPDGSVLAWLRWDHPDMPWDAAELWAARVEQTDDALVLSDPRRVAGGRDGAAKTSSGHPVAVCLPLWAPDGRLWWCDDSDGWWNLHRAPAPGLPAEGAGDEPSTHVGVAEECEVGEPRWVAGGSRYGFTADGKVVLAASSGGIDRLWSLDPSTGEREPAPGPVFTSIEQLAVVGHHVAVIGGDSTRPNSVWLIDLDSGDAEDLRPVTAPLAPGWVSTPEPIAFRTGPSLGADADGPVAHALFYPPVNGDHVAPDGTRPPLVVRIHGGPTAAARPEFSTSVQFWTTRGFAVADVNYRGSVGYGRPYRDALNGQWGVADVEDCISLTRHLAAAGLVDGSRCVIRGGSAGGFTALASVCFQGDWGAPGAFAAACSLYGVTDLAALAADTHKFESRYLDGLVAPLPDGADVYRDRSPLFHADKLVTPVLLLQGTEDRIVPPAQAEVLVEALKANGVRHEYVLFSGESHGFVRSETVIRALETELGFYTEVLGLDTAR